MFKKIMIVIIISVTCSGCGAGVGDVTEDLGNGYTYWAEGRDRFIRGGDIFTTNIYPNVLNYSFDENYIIAVQAPSENSFKTYLRNDLILRFRGILYNSDKKAKLSANQREFLNSKWWADSLLHKKIASGVSKDNYNNDEMIELVVDSVIKHDLFYRELFRRKLNYYIIQKKNFKMYGPFSEDVYLAERKRLGIAPNLTLNK